MYKGPMGEARPYFENMVGQALPHRTSLTDWIVNLNPDYGHDVDLDSMAKAWSTSAACQKESDRVESALKRQVLVDK